MHTDDSFNEGGGGRRWGGVTHCHGGACTMRFFLFSDARCGCLYTAHPRLSFYAHLSLSPSLSRSLSFVSLACDETACAPTSSTCTRWRSSTTATVLIASGRCSDRQVSFPFPLVLRPVRLSLVVCHHAARVCAVGAACL